MTYPAIFTSSWDDGHPLDRKLADLLRDYDLPATFYVPLRNPERETMDAGGIETLASEFDVGGHTLTHRRLDRLDRKAALREIRAGKEALERITGQPPRMFCYPKGKYTAETVELVRRCGFIGARTVRPLDVRIDSPFELGTTVHAGVGGYTLLKNRLRRRTLPNDLAFARYFLTNGLFVRDGLETALAVLNYVVEHGGVFHLWGHSWEIDQWNKWRQLERLFRAVSRRDELIRLDNAELVERFA